MKRRVLTKTVLFHALFFLKKREKARNGAVLNGTIIFFTWMCKTGEEEDLFSFLCHRLLPL